MWGQKLRLGTKPLVVLDLFANSSAMLAIVSTLLSYLSSLFRPKYQLALEVLALRHPIIVLKPQTPRPKLRRWDRGLWVRLKRVWPGWKTRAAFAYKRLFRRLAYVMLAERTSRGWMEKDQCNQGTTLSVIGLLPPTQSRGFRAQSRAMKPDHVRVHPFAINQVTTD